MRRFFVVFCVVFLVLTPPPLHHLPFPQPFQSICSWNVTDNKSYAWSFVLVALMGFSRHLLIVFRQALATANSQSSASGRMGKARLGGSGAAAGLLIDSNSNNINNNNTNDSDDDDNNNSSSIINNGSSGNKNTQGNAGGGLHVRLQRALKFRFLQRTRWILVLADALLFAASATLGFLNMLITMTYNPGMLMAVVLGETIGVVTLENPGGLSAFGVMNEAESRDQSCH